MINCIGSLNRRAVMSVIGMVWFSNLGLFLCLWLQCQTQPKAWFLVVRGDLHSSQGYLLFYSYAIGMKGLWSSQRRKFFPISACSSFICVAVVLLWWNTLTQSNLEEGRVYLTLQNIVYYLGKSGQEIKQELEAETVEECMWPTGLLTDACLTSFLIQLAGPSYSN